jgi:LmbE family N-acetylglucosaminyl deacetylase
MKKKANLAQRARGRRGPRAESASICVHLRWLLAALLFAVSPAGAQQGNGAGAGAGLGTGHGLAETLEAIERARVVTRVLYVTAHPDDEPGPVLTWLARGAHAEVALLSLTRGEGGQNALGPEQAPQLGLLRTEELLAAARYYGVRVYFAGAADFGYCKNAEEALGVWGQPVLANMVRVVREFRPHIVINNWGGVRTGHCQHQAAGILTPLAAVAAADPQQFPEQITEGLRSWRASHLLQFARGTLPSTAGAPARSAADPVELPTNGVSPLWGQTYTEIGIEGYTQHRTQGVEGVRQSAFIRRLRQLQVAQGGPLGSGGFSMPLFSLRVFFRVARNSSPRSPNVTSFRFSQNLVPLNESLERAREAVAKLNWRKAAVDLAAAGSAISEPMNQTTGGADEHIPDMLWEMEQVRRRIDHALALAAGARVVAVADRGEIVPGGSFTVRVETLSRADVGVKWDEPRLDVPPGWTATRVPPRQRDEDGVPRFTVTVPADAEPNGAFLFGIEPWPAPLVRARLRGSIEGYSFEVVEPVTAQRFSTTRVDTLPLALVPAVTLTPEPRQFVLAERQPPRPLELRARVRHYGAGAAEVTVGVDVPAGWTAPAPVKLQFAAAAGDRSVASDQLVRVTVMPPARLAAGSYELKPWARLGGARYETSLEPLPTLPTRLWSEPATVMARVFDVNVPAGLRVGYIAAENDPIPDSLRQIGVEVELLDEAALAFGDLSRYDAIAVGIRAYELRGDLMRANQRLLDYAAAGGTLVVQYQRGNVWNALRPAPYPASVGERGPGAAAPPAPPPGAPQPVREARVTDENSPVRLLRPEHPALSTPNKIGPADFEGWVQERGLYLWDKFDPRYEPLLAMNDPGEMEATGAVVYARIGKGHYVFAGLSLFRQLPAGVPGGYRLLVNLLSLSKN